MQTNPNAPVWQSAQMHVQAAPETVWSVLTEVHQWPVWHAAISQAAIGSAAAPGVPFRWKIRSSVIRSVFHTVQPCTRLGWSGITFGGSAIHNWVLTPDTAGTLVQVEESMDGWLIRLFRRQMNTLLAADMQEWLESLKRRCEAAAG
ncbi:MAG: SRPBCC family protein [Bacteroidia bacterium]|nr:SRPBCC family protein [Bacteroidia bacterium]